jgi:hypothetical protein
MTLANRGTAADEWFHFDFVLGLGGNLLPCVPAGPDVRVLAGSALAGKVGKIPSQFNHAGEAHGLKEWQKREIMSNEIVAWSKDPRLNICVRTGPISGVYAFDVDVEDVELAREIREHLQSPRSTNSARERSNSAKFLIPFRMDTPCKKRKIKLDTNPKGPAIELLADGQQFVACGSHSSGVRYQWQPGLPDSLPTLTLDQVNQIWAALTSAFATKDSAKDNQIVQAGVGTTTPTNGTDSTNSILSTISDEDWQQLLSALRFLTDKVADNDTWTEVGYALISLQATRPASQLWHDFSKKAVGYVEGADTAWWEAHRTQTTRTDYRHIFTMARERGMARVAAVEAFTLVSSDPETESPGPGGSDTATASEGISVVSDAPIRPLVQLSDPRYSDIVDQIETILVPHVYVQGPNLVRQTEAHDDAGIERKEDALMLIKVSKEWLTYKLGELVVWQKWLKSDANWVPTKPSIEHINTLANLNGWSQLRPLDAIARSPFLRPDGSICDTAGYDRRARVLYVPSTEFPAIPADPDQDCAREALGRIRGVFDQFPYKEPASESAFLSHILTEAARVAIPHSPMFFYDAPSSGTGKSLLQEMAARIVHGSEPALRPWVGDGDEIRKALYASLLAGDRSLWFDNVPTGHKTRSAELCAFISSSTWKDRKLGESETLGVPNKCVLVASGNNITPTGDLARRSLVVRLNANTERLRERVFKIPEGQLRPYVMEHRPQMLVDALTVIKAFHAVKDIEMPVPLPGFGPWSHYCRDPLIWLGLADPVITQNETDDESTSVGNVYEKLFAQFGDREFTSLDVARLVNGITDSSGELANDMQQNGCKEPNSPLKVGYWLRGFRDRISHGIKLTPAGNGKTGVKWKFVKMNEDLT